MSATDRVRRWTLPTKLGIVSLACFTLIAASAHAGARVVQRPGAGPAGTKLVLVGSDFSDRRAVTVTGGGRVLARGRTTREGTFRLAFRAPAGPSIALVTRSARQKVVTMFRVAPSTSQSGQIAAEGSARVRWTVDGRTVLLQGAGLGRPIRTTVRLGGMRASLRVRGGRFTRRLRIPGAGAKVGIRVSTGGLELTFAVSVAFRAVERPPPPSPPAPTADAPCGTAPPSRGARRVVWIVFENKAAKDVIGSPAAPYISGLAGRCGLATSFFGETHPSLPNYIAMTSGSTQGVIDGAGPSVHPLSAPSIFSQLGSDWRVLAESMPSNCAEADTELYAVRHNPAVYYTGVRAACARQDVPLAMPLDLSARFTLIIPNLCNGMHWCPTSGADRDTQIRAGDAFLATWLPRMVSTPEYASGGMVIVVTWDEDDYGAEPIPTLVISPSTRPGTRVGTRFDHYALLRTTEELLGLSLLGNAASAPSMRSGFGL